MRNKKPLYDLIVSYAEEVVKRENDLLVLTVEETEYASHARAASQIHQVVEEILVRKPSIQQSKFKIADIARKRHGQAWLMWKCTDIFESVERLSADFRYSTEVELCREYVTQLRAAYDQSRLGFERKFDLQGEANRFIDFLQARVGEKSFKARRNRDLNKVRRRRLRAAQYLGHLVAQYNQLLVLRLNLAFASPGVSLQQASAYFAKFLNSSRGNRSLFRHQVGYVWHLDSPKAGEYFFHIVLFFDGLREVRQDTELSALVGLYWMESITGGLGSYWDWAILRGYPQGRGTGRIAWNDDTAINRLRSVIDLMAVRDSYSQAADLTSERCFGTGEMHRRSPKNRGSSSSSD